ncbi:MAG: hypothetical protein J4215_02435 [Candidatus Diapherotrites archaeon]|uniref:Uncharacterized protein n=1 Tax=Candidatus Iainarchaeum sp. TaxID=3101447 RepID=A0A8T4L270_9ARCH|nr:hypothetical protein [Candidatus Diapherotrites archaeon]
MVRKKPRQQPNDFLFCTTNGPPKPISNQLLNLTLKRLAIKVGLGHWAQKKSSKGFRYSQYEGQKIYFTKFRRSAATWALKNLKSQSLACKRIWGNESSQMIKIYSGLISDDANQAYREAIGIVSPPCCFCLSTHRRRQKIVFRTTQRRYVCHNCLHAFGGESNVVQILEKIPLAEDAIFGTDSKI